MPIQRGEPTGLVRLKRFCAKCHSLIVPSRPGSLDSCWMSTKLLSVKSELVDCNTDHFLRTDCRTLASRGTNAAAQTSIRARTAGLPFERRPPVTSLRGVGRPGPQALLEQIDDLPAVSRERDRIQLISKSGYVDFVAAAFGRGPSEILNFLSDLSLDEEFFSEFLPQVARLGALSSAGDLRFHSLTCYVAARCEPNGPIFETGVASGKSSTYFLLGLLHASTAGSVTGRLVSIDLPADGSLAADGSNTDLGDCSVGWLVPAWLRDKWDLMIGSSEELLPDALQRFGAPRLFLHDSLHTHDNKAMELRLVLSANPSALILCDNLEMGSGTAFSEVSAEFGLQTYTFGNFGVARRPH